MWDVAPDLSQNTNPAPIAGINFAGAHAIGDVVVVCGGHTFIDSPYTQYSTQNCDIYNVTTGGGVPHRFTKTTHLMSVARARPLVGKAWPYLLVVGGEAGLRPDVEAYDVRTNTWSVWTGVLSTGVYSDFHPASITDHNTLTTGVGPVTFFMGGQATMDVFYANGYAGNPSDQWYVTNIPENAGGPNYGCANRIRGGAATVFDLLVVGGGNGGPGGTGGAKDVCVFNASSRTWWPAPAFQIGAGLGGFDQKRVQGAMCAVGPLIVMAGGADGMDSFHHNVQIFNLFTGAMVVQLPLNGRRFIFSTTYQDRYAIIGPGSNTYDIDVIDCGPGGSLAVPKYIFRTSWSPSSPARSLYFNTIGHNRLTGQSYLFYAGGSVIGGPPITYPNVDVALITDGCHSNPCSNAGLCMSHPFTGWNCTCPFGFTGATCSGFSTGIPEATPLIQVAPF